MYERQWERKGEVGHQARQSLALTPTHEFHSHHDQPSPISLSPQGKPEVRPEDNQVGPTKNKCTNVSVIAARAMTPSKSSVLRTMLSIHENRMSQVLITCL